MIGDSWILSFLLIHTRTYTRKKLGAVGLISLNSETLQKQNDLLNMTCKELLVWAWRFGRRDSRWHIHSLRCHAKQSSRRLIPLPYISCETQRRRRGGTPTLTSRRVYKVMFYQDVLSVSEGVVGVRALNLKWKYVTLLL